MEIKYGGVSVKGMHEINQDCYTCHTLNNLTFCVLSDGLGSKIHSDIGSKAICNIIANLIIDNPEITNDINSLIQIAYDNWVKKLSSFDLEDCCCTCLICIIKENEVITAHLGDGFICVFDDDNYFISRGEELDFINETHSLSSKLKLDKWVINSFNSSKKLSVIMFSDGISINNDTDTDILDFCKDLSLEYENLASFNIEKNIKLWLDKWLGSDDKTLTFFIRK